MITLFSSQKERTQQKLGLLTALFSEVAMSDQNVRFDAVWLHRSTKETRPRHFEYILQSWDTTNKASEMADYSVCTTWGIQGKTMYLLDVIRERLEYPELKRLVIHNMNRWDAKHVLIEDKASGVQLIQELQKTNYKAKGIKCTDEKTMRAHEQTPAIEPGNALLPKETPWLKCFVKEALAFPFAKYDDQVDSMAQAI